jgi:hypothetical protein
MKADELMLKTLSRKKYKSLLLKSRYVLDLPTPKQSGVSLRTYEALASGCALITTSKSIAQEPFFDDKSIFIVDANHLEESIPVLLKQEYTNPQALPFDEYSLSAWVNKIFSYSPTQDIKKIYKMEEVK